MAYRVLVVDDSAFMRKELSKIINSDPSLKVVGTAENGSEAVKKNKALRPDVVSLDINMPVMDGLEALKIIMDEAPCSVVMVSALTYESAEETIKALELGAFDFFHKPSGSISLDIVQQSEIIKEKLKTAAASKLVKRKKRSWGKLEKSISTAVKFKNTISIPRKSRIVKKENIVAIGVSTGGPKTLMSVLPKIPIEFNGCIVIAQHMPEKFTLSFANRLNEVCQLTVKEARDGDVLQVGRIYIAPGGKHLKIVDSGKEYLRVNIVDAIPDYTYMPSVDLLFRSLTECSDNLWLGVMLTGMGGDGAIALSNHRKKGGRTIAEAKESCVVFGMPRKVIEMDGAEFILSESQIADKIVDLIGYRNAT